MSNYQPNWKLLEAHAANYKNSSALIPQIATAAPHKGFVFTSLTGDLTNIVKTALKTHNPLKGGLVIVVDTLNIAEGEIKIPSIGVQIIARSVKVLNNGNANLIVTSINIPNFQIATSEIKGKLSVTLGVGATAQVVKVASDKAPPQVQTLSANGASISNSANDIADVFHSPWSILGAELTFSAASYLVELDNKEAKQLASQMLRWVTGVSHALIKERANYTNLDIANISSLQANSMALLSFTQASVTNATYVPALSVNLYEKEMNGLLKVAGAYNQKIQDFKSQENTDELLNKLASTLKSINSEAKTPLFNTLKRLVNQSQLAQGELTSAALQLNNISKTLAPLQDAIDKAVADQFQKELLETAFKMLFKVITLYISVGAILVDPALIGAESGEIAKAALEIAEKLAEAGEELISQAIESGSTAAHSPPTIPNLNETGNGAEVLMGAQVGFGLASALLWDIVSRAIASGENQINFSPDMVKAMDKIPNLNGFSIGGIDPTTYWEIMVVQVKASLEPLLSGSETGAPARAYIEAIELSSTYGKGIGDQQAKLLELYNQGMIAFDQLSVIHQAEAQWNALEAKLATKEAKINAAIGFLEKGYTNLKRSIVLSVNNYRAAFNYQWLRPSTVTVDSSMTYLQLVQNVENSIESLKNVLHGNLPNVIKPRQDFGPIDYYVRPELNPLFKEVNGKGQAQWSITLKDTTLSEQLNGNTAFFITEATFELQGASQSGEVELQIETSANYSNKLNGKEFRFVSSGFSMSSDYKPDLLPAFITKWEFAKEDAPNYLTPSPYTQWTLTVDKGNWKNVTAIKMTISGFEIQNARNI
ncbi:MULTISPECIES: hypothetical protein [unclassified Lacinutrix]